MLARRSIQRLLDGSAAYLDLPQINRFVTHLNRNNPDSLEAEWELIILAALSSIGIVQHEPNLGGSDDPGHGPHFQLTQKVDGHTVTQGLPSPAAVRKAQNEIDEYRKFLSLTDDLVDVNRKICRLRPVEQAQQTAQEKKRRKPSSKKSPVK